MPQGRSRSLFLWKIFTAQVQANSMLYWRASEQLGSDLKGVDDREVRRLGHAGDDTCHPDLLDALEKSVRSTLQIRRKRLPPYDAEYVVDGPTAVKIPWTAGESIR